MKTGSKSANTQRRVLITGANGFIGQHLARACLEAKYQVRAMKCEERGLYFINRQDVEWWNGDLSRPNEYNGICNGIDTVFHLAAIPRNDVSKSRDDFSLINIRGTESLLKQAQQSGVCRFVFISTVEAAGYGDGINPRRETDTPNPENNYGRSKLDAEKIVMNGSWRFECVTVRLPMIYGPGTFLIVPKLFGMVKKGFYPLIGNGKTLMEFCYVANAIQGILLAGIKKEAVGEIFYISDERSYTIREVVSTIAKVMKKKVFFLTIPKSFAYCVAFLWEAAAKIFPFPPLVSPYSKKPFFSRETVWWTTRNVNIVSTEKIRRLLGYNPKVSIETGCAETAEWLSLQTIGTR
jgi:nucleoside-diphosphate-sugar epimerase